MAIVINGSGTVTGLAVGGLPDGTVDAGTLATDSVTAAKLEVSAITGADLPAGSVLQVENFVMTAESISTTSTSYVDSGLTYTITPTSTSSKILIHVVINGLYKSQVAGNVNLNIVRGSTELVNFGSMAIYHTNSSTSAQAGTASLTIVDSPNTTSTTTYKVQFRSISGDTIYFNARYNSTYRERSSITLTEIAG